MTADEVLAALRAQNLQVAGGALGQPPQPDMGAFQLSLQLKGRLLDPGEFANIVLKTGQDGRVVRVKDVGRVELGALNYTTYGYQDEFPATVMIVTQQPGSNAIATANAIKTEMKRISQRFPKGLEYRIIYNPTEFIEVSIARLYLTILEAIALVVIVVLAVPADVAGDHHSARRHSRLACRHVRDDGGARLLHQHADAVRARARRRHRRRRRDRRGGERRAQAARRAQAGGRRARHHERGRHRAHRDRAGAHGGVRADRLPRRHHRTVLPPVRRHGRDRDHYLRLQLAHLEPGAVRRAA